MNPTILFSFHLLLPFFPKPPLPSPSNSQTKPNGVKGTMSIDSQPHEMGKTSIHIKLDQVTQSFETENEKNVQIKNELLMQKQHLFIIIP
jgi:hypothetical protein